MEAMTTKGLCFPFKVHFRIVTHPSRRFPGNHLGRTVVTRVNVTVATRRAPTRPLLTTAE